MSDNAPTVETINPNGPTPAEAQWADAAAKAEAFEKQQIAEAVKAQSTKPAPEPKSDPEPEPEKEAAVEAEADTEPAPEAEGTEASDRVKALHELAKELGMKVDARGVTKDERYGFRQEKRQWQEKVQKTEADFKQRLAATEAYFAPLHPAVEALKAGDIDTAIRKLGEAIRDDELANAGLNAANKRVLKRASGEDPRIDELQKKLEARERRDAEIAQHYEEQRQQAAYKAEREAFTKARADELKLSEDATIARLAEKPIFAERVVAVMEQHWDGTETVTTEEAAQEVAKQLRGAYDELCEVFGDPDPSTRETPDASSVAGRSGRTTVGKKPKPHNGKHATEASPPGRALTDEEWRRKHAALMALAKD